MDGRYIPARSCIQGAGVPHLEAKRSSPLGGNVIIPDRPTCFPCIGDCSLLDYFLVARGIAALKPNCSVMQDTAVPTHRPMVLILSLAGNLELVRSIRLSREIDGPSP